MKRSIYYILIIAAAFATGLWSCNKSGDGPTQNSPVIIFDSEDLVFRVKHGKTLLLEPEVQNNEDASYRWLLDGTVVGQEASYLFPADKEVGDYYLTFEVANSAATVSEDIRVEVVMELPPYITIAVPESGITIQTGMVKEFKPTVANSDDARFRWTIDGVLAAETKDYAFHSDVAGAFELEFTAENEDGERSVKFVVTVLDAADMPFSWEWEKDTFTAVVGRTVVLGPLPVSGAVDPVYVWRMGDAVLQEGSDSRYAYKPEAAGTYTLTLDLTSEYTTISHDVTVEVYDGEDANRRPVGGASKPEVVKVWEFLPAPGQFVNDDYAASTMEEAAAYAENRLKNKQFVSLGAFGGYIVAGFDHSVENDGGYNIQIVGNSYKGSSEPGIVWVMQDENGDGKPNDTWYELKGSEHGKPGTWYEYAVTYYRPADESGGYPWTDNRGGEGTVERNNFHRQTYYPMWVSADSYTLRGTRLEPRTTQEGNIWTHGSYDWGYADNYGSDRNPDEGSQSTGGNANHFKIDNAVDRNGNAVKLKYIDFVKVQTGVLVMAGWLGENSTEVFGIYDYNMKK